jgi:hypothetical protein
MATINKKKNKTKTTTKLNTIQNKNKKAKQKQIYLQYMNSCKWSINLSGFDSTIISFYTFYIRVISLTTGKMVLDLTRVTTYLQTDDTFNVEIKLVINTTPQIPQH